MKKLFISKRTGLVVEQPPIEMWTPGDVKQWESEHLVFVPLEYYQQREIETAYYRKLYYQAEQAKPSPVDARTHDDYVDSLALLRSVVSGVDFAAPGAVDVSMAALRVGAETPSGVPASWEFVKKRVAELYPPRETKFQAQTLRTYTDKTYNSDGTITWIDDIRGTSFTTNAAGELTESTWVPEPWRKVLPSAGDV